MTLDIVIPMAGRGSRFANVGYKLPKPLIDVAGRPMIQRVIDNLRPKMDHRFTFLVLADHLKEFELEPKLRQWAGPETKCIPVSTVTEGQACTVLLAEKNLSADRDMMIANADQYIDASFSDFVSEARQDKLDGSILVFEDSDPKWSFAKIDAKGLVTEVAEKKPISNLATAGIYYFRNGVEFTKYAHAMIKKNLRVNNEFYVCPIYNELIADKKRVKTWKIEKSRMHGLGTPEDLNKYLAGLK